MNRFFGGTGYLLVSGIMVSVAAVVAWAFIGAYGFNRSFQSLQGTVEALGPSWSPDGRRVVFASNENGNYDIYVQNADGSERRNITGTADESSQPIWSPDGSWIAYISKGRQGFDIHVVRPDGSGRSNLTNFPSLYSDIAWSPEGKKIAFISNRDVRRIALIGNQFEGPMRPPERRSPDIYVMNADGSDVRRLTFDLASDRRPAWSPDSSKIAFQSTRDGDSEIYIIGADGKALTKLTKNEFTDIDPAWSPDGTRIALASARIETEFQRQLEEGRTMQPFSNITSANIATLTTGVNFDIYVVSADGTRSVNLSNSPSSADTRPVWSPDGGYIAFDGAHMPVQSGVPGSTEIYVLTVDGARGIVPVTGTSLARFSSPTHASPRWSPDGRMLAYISKDRYSVAVDVVEIVEVTVP